MGRLAMTEWRALPVEYGPYEVSDSGSIRNATTGIKLRHETVRTGHRRVTLYPTPGNPKRFFVHRLVARAFIGDSRLDVLHWDDDPGNNRVENLRYGTDRENWWDGVRNGRRRVEDTCPSKHDYPVRDGQVIRRCPTCESEASKIAYLKALKAGLTSDDPRHGTYSGYQARCRCVRCHEANRQYKTEWARENRRRKRELRS